MKKLFSMILFMSIFSSFVAVGQVSNLNAQNFKKTIESTKLILIDVRSAQEYAQGHIAKAINIDVSDPNFALKLKKQLGNAQSLAIYCRSGRRSKAAISMLGSLKIKIYELNNGINDWQRSGLPLVK